MPPVLAGAGDQVQDQPRPDEAEQNGVGGGECLSIQRHGQQQLHGGVDIHQNAGEGHWRGLHAGGEEHQRHSGHHAGHRQQQPLPTREDPGGAGAVGLHPEDQHQGKGRQGQRLHKGGDRRVGTDLLLQRPVNSKAAADHQGDPGDLPVADALNKTVAGVGPVVCREAAWRAFDGEHLLANELDDAQKRKLMVAIDELKELHHNGGCPCSVTAPDGKPVEFTFFRPQQYGDTYIIKEWPSFNALLEGYYAEKDRAERLRTKSKELHKAVHNMYERAVRKQAARQEELAASGKSEKLRLYGELLSANLYMAQKGMKSITVPNWYDEGKEVTIPLDLRFSPSQNAQNFFKNYKKKQTAARMLVDLLAEGEKEIAYLETVLYEVETAAGEAALNEIRAELKSQGYLKYYKQRDKRQKPADFLRFTSSDGFEILVGRNNAQNDKLTLHTARGKDLWFHVQKAPGSHVVVMSRGEDIPDTTRQEAAELAVIYSSAYKAGTGAKVAVDTTEVKNIWKANGAKPGMVLYEVYTTVYITPRDGLEEQLKQKK